MGSIDVSIYYDQYRVEAMERILASQNRTIGQEIQGMMDALYEYIVPEHERSDIEDKILHEKRRCEAEDEASRRFALVHLHDGNEDYYLLSERHKNFLQAARLYRVVTKDIHSLLGRGGQSPLSELQQMRIAFMDHEPLTEEAYTKLVENAPNDYRITAMIEFDFENWTISTCESSDNHWSTYTLKDASTAVFRADRRMGIPEQLRREIFDRQLEEKEIDCDLEEGITESIQMQ